MQQVATIGREDFVSSRFSYDTGEHVTFLAPTGAGKTMLAYALLAQAGTVKRPAVSLVMKPRDSTVTAAAKQLDHRIVRSWPPAFNPWSPRKPPGFMLWPKHSFDPDKDDEKLRAEFRRAMIDCYKRGSRIVFADETMGLTQELGLEKTCVALWNKGRSMGTGFWAATQRPSHIPLPAYSQATHLFLGNSSDKRDRDRYAEIGGVDPDLVKTTVVNLDRFQWLYIRKAGKKPGAMCVIDAN